MVFKSKFKNRARITLLDNNIIIQLAFSVLQDITLHLIDYLSSDILLDFEG